MNYVSSSKSVKDKTEADVEKLAECTTTTGYVLIAVHRDDLQAFTDFQKLLANVKKNKANAQCPYFSIQ